MYPGTQYAWHDESYITANAPVAADDNTPIFMVASAFSQGTEDCTEIESLDFNNMFGSMNYFKYGQVSIQAQNTIDAGGRLFVKRLVADDATLANIVLAVNLSSKQKERQKYDDNGNPLYYTDESKSAETTDVTNYPVMELVYLDEDGNETTEDTGNPVTVAVLKWEAKTVEGATDDYETASAAVDELVQELNEQDGVYPIFVIKDNGRGASAKAIRISPDYVVSRTSERAFYHAIVYNNNAKVEDKVFTIDPDVIYANTAYRLDEYSCTQVKGIVDEVAFERFVSDLADITMLEPDVVRSFDLVNGLTYRGTTVDKIIIDDESIDLNASTGIALQSGSDGAFTDSPMSTAESQEALYDKMEAYYSGLITDEIYDVDSHLVCAVLDAGFPNRVKTAIGDLVCFRKDMIYFRDIGIGHYTFGDVYAAVKDLPEIKPWCNENATITNDASSYENGKFFADYITSYKIKDPLTKKRVEVTMLYDMATVLVDHFLSSPNAPLAGQYNNFVLASAIKGTLNFVPLNTPNVNQKQALEDLHVNYANFEGTRCVVQCLYTCQQKYSQLSYLNNVIAIQHVMRVVRRACPRNRFSLADGRDLSNYARAVERVLEDYESMFKVLKFEYTQNDLQADQKIFAASIRFAFHNWAQTEYFDLFAIPTPSPDEAIEEE